MRLAVSVLVLVLAGGAARAEPPRPAPKPGAEKGPVRVGPTTVTVIDEQESVDDIISRVRRARQKRAVEPQTPPAVQPPTPPPAGDDRKPKLRDGKGKDDDRGARKQARERLQRLRETARERRANRLRGTRAE